MCVDAVLNSQKLGGDVVDARGDSLLVGLGREERIEPRVRSRRSAFDSELVVERQDDRSEVWPVRSGGVYKCSGLAVTQPGRQRSSDSGEECGVSPAKRNAGVVAPQVEEPPAAKLVCEDRGRHIADSVSAQDVAPHRALAQVSGDRIAQGAGG
jgi:hypothetical protein